MTDTTTLDRNIRRYLYLCYYNRILRQQGTITDAEYYAMHRLITTRYPISGRSHRTTK